MKTQLLLISIFLLMLSVGCEKDLPNNNIVILPTDTFPKNVEFEIIKEGGKSGHYGNKAKHVCVVNTDTAWTTMQNRVGATIDSPINFDSSTVIVVFSQYCVSAPSTIDIVNITAFQDSVVVKEESSSCGPYLIPSQGYQMAKTRKLTKAFVLKEN